MKNLFSLLGLLVSCCNGLADNLPARPDPHEVAQQVITDMGRGHATFVQLDAPHDIPILEQGTKDFPSDAQIYFALGMCYGQQGERQKSLTNMEKAYELSKKDPIIGATYAVELRLNKNPLKAYEVDEVLLAAHPGDAKLQFCLASTGMPIQKYDEAVVLLEPFVLTPRSDFGDKDIAMVDYMLGRCYLYKGEYEKAIDAFDKSLARFPGMVGSFEALGEAYLKMGDTAKAQAALDKSLSTHPRVAPPFYYRGLVFEKSGDLKAADKNFQKAYAILKDHLDSNGENGEDHYLMYLICLKLSKKDEAEENRAEAAKLLFTYEAPWKAK